MRTISSKSLLLLEFCNQRIRLLLVNTKNVGVCIECVCAHVLSIKTYCEAVVDILSAGLCNAGIRQIHLIKDKRLQRREGVVVEERNIQKAGQRDKGHKRGHESESVEMHKAERSLLLLVYYIMKTAVTGCEVNVVSWPQQSSPKMN